MRLDAITIRNYRIHRNLRVAFDPSLTLIGGPNESGKSTIAEAVFNALFMSYKRGGTGRDRLVSRHGGHPEIEVVFEAGGGIHSLHKTFRGPQGTCMLSGPDGRTWDGTGAEEKLLALCGLDGASNAGRGLPVHWDYLWIRQGTSDSDPTGFATTHKDALVARIQSDGAAALLQSELDARVAAEIRAERNALVTARGFKTGSEPDLATKAAATATRAREDAENICAALVRAADDFEAAERDIARSEKSLASLSGELLSTQQNLIRAGELRTSAEKQSLAVRHAVEELDRLAGASTQIADLTARIEHASGGIASREAALKGFHHAGTAARAAHAQAGAAVADAARRTAAARARLDLAALWVGRFEQAALVGNLRERVTQARAIRSRLASLPDITPARLKTLQKLDREREKLTAMLDAISTRVEVIEAGLSVCADNKPLEPGTPLVFSNDMLLAVGDATRLRITPGGGTGLAETRARLSEAESSLQQNLDAPGLSSVAAAEDACRQRNELTVRIEGTDTIEQQLADELNRLETTEEEIRRRAIKDFPEPPDAAAARMVHLTCQKVWEDSDAGHAAAAAALGARFRDLEEAVQSTQSLTAGIEKERASLEGLKGRLAQLVSSHGDDAARAAALAALEEAKTRAAAGLAETRAALDGLRPEALAADEKRIARAIETHREARNQAGQRLAVARNLLHREGPGDPFEDLALARSAEESALGRLSAARRHADAIVLLDRLFAETRQALTDQFTRPLAEKVSGYLKCLFGPGAEARVTLGDNAFEALVLERPREGTFAFADLSGGTREQTAVAFRLAMAEILAQNHEGCLPVFLDDAFTHSDETRVAALPRMLDLAASRGLQIIVFSSSPADYAALGARTVTLPPVPDPAGSD